MSELTCWVAARGHVRRNIEPFRQMAAGSMMTMMARARHTTAIPPESERDHP